MPRSSASAAADVVPFYMHTAPALDHAWLRHCPAFERLRRSAYNERLAEVYLRDALAVHRLIDAIALSTACKALELGSCKLIQ